MFYAFLKTLAKIRFFFDIRKARLFSACVCGKLLYYPIEIGLKQAVLQYTIFFKLALGKGFGNFGGYLPFVRQNYFVIQLQKYI